MPHKTQEHVDLLLLRSSEGPRTEVHDLVTDHTCFVQESDEQFPVEIPAHPLPSCAVFQQLAVLPVRHVLDRLKSRLLGDPADFFDGEDGAKAAAEAALDLAELKEGCRQLTELTREVGGGDDG